MIIEKKHAEEQGRPVRTPNEMIETYIMPILEGDRKEEMQRK